MQLRRAEQRHLVALSRLVERAYRGDSARQGWTHEADLLGGQRTDLDALAAIVADPAQRLLFSGEPGNPSACVALADKRNGLVYMGLVTVDPARQGDGLGRFLLGAAERWAQSDFKARRIEMTVIAQRSELIDWYCRRGYRPTAERRPFPYGDPRFGEPKRPDLEFVVLEKALA